MRTTGSRGTLLLLACVLVVLAGCGGGTAVDAEAMLRITPPDDPDDVAIAIGPGGSVEVLRGLTEKDRAAGRRYPSRHVAPASADEIRAVADEREGWHSLQRALDRAVGTGTSDVALTLLEAGGGHRTLRFVLRCWAAQERAAHQRFHVTISVVEGKRRLAVDLPGGAWLRTHGCQREEAWSSPWAGGPPPAAFVDLLYRVLAVVDHEPSALDVRVEVDGGTDETPCTIADVASVLEAFLGVGVTTLDLGLGTVHGSRKPGVVETGLRWLAAHQTSEGDWHGDAWPQWCDRERMPTSEVGDGDPRFDVGATGLALTAFLGAGYTHRGRHPFAKTVTLGLRDLKHRQAADGTYAEPGTPYRARNQALAALALGRAVELTESRAVEGSGGSRRGRAAGRLAGRACRRGRDRVCGSRRRRDGATAPSARTSTPPAGHSREGRATWRSPSASPAACSSATTRATRDERKPSWASSAPAWGRSASTRRSSSRLPPGASGARPSRNGARRRGRSSAARSARAIPAAWVDPGTFRKGATCRAGGSRPQRSRR